MKKFLYWLKWVTIFSIGTFVVMGAIYYYISIPHGLLFSEGYEPLIAISILGGIIGGFGQLKDKYW